MAEFISFEKGKRQNIPHISIFKRKVLGIVTTVLSYQICLKALKKKLELCTTLLGFRVEKGWH